MLNYRILQQEAAQFIFVTKYMYCSQKSRYPKLNILDVTSFLKGANSLPHISNDYGKLEESHGTRSMPHITIVDTDTKTEKYVGNSKSLYLILLAKLAKYNN